MAQSTLVTELLGDGLELAQRFNAVVPLEAVFWYRESESDQWYLNLACANTSDAQHSNAVMQFVLVYRNFYENGDFPWLDMFQVKITGSSDKLAHEVIQYQNRHLGVYRKDRVIRLQNRRFDSRYFDEIYLYPLELIQNRSISNNTVVV